MTKKILLLLAAGLDEIADWDKTLTSPYLSLKFISYKDDYFQKIIRQMLKAGQIERIVKRGEPFFRVTSRGKIKLVYDIPLAKRFGQKWDGKWRMVIFDIPEISKTKRDGLRRKLKELGFAQWQKSVYITPFDVAVELAEHLGVNNLSDNAIALEAKKIFVGDEKEMANRLWRLDDLNLKYQNFVEKYQKEKDKKSWEEEYLAILEVDPCLPSDLLPQPWWKNQAKKLVYG
ncbi:hypothetical protein M1545_00725 [Patescibacteria group bacterium]|nr:hypothetical protein [Patescibacteria group bacterium]